MKGFVKEFRDNLKYLADELGNAFGGYSDSWTQTEAFDKAEEVLKDWISEYQSTENQLEEDIINDFDYYEEDRI